MKRIFAAVAAAAMILAAGCMSIGQYGAVTEDAIADGVQLFLAKQGLAGLVTPEQTKQFMALVKADAEMQALATQIDAQVLANTQLQDRIAELGRKYISAGQFVDPSTNAAPAAATAP